MSFCYENTLYYWVLPQFKFTRVFAGIGHPRKFHSQQFEYFFSSLENGRRESNKEWLELGNNSNLDTEEDTNKDSVCKAKYDLLRAMSLAKTEEEKNRKLSVSFNIDKELYKKNHGHSYYPQGRNSHQCWSQTKQLRLLCLASPLLSIVELESGGRFSIIC